MRYATWAQSIARLHLAGPMPRRWSHTQGVAARARSLAEILGDHADLFEAAAWLHDVGYAPDLSVTDFHPLDGARFLRDALGAEALLCSLVAHHSSALTEARVRGHADDLVAEFDQPPPRLAIALTFCDMTTSPDGDPVSVEDRLHEVLGRYGADHVVSRSISRARPYLISSVQQIYRLLDESFNRDRVADRPRETARLAFASSGPS